MVLYIIDAVAGLFVVVGFCLAFQQRLLRGWFRRGDRAPGGPDADEAQGVASALRMAGVMIMALSFTLAAFANLLSYYSRAGRS